MALIALTSIAGCRTPPSSEANKPICRRSPYLARFKKGDKQLVYIAADHGHGPESKNATFRMIHALFDSLKPQIVVVEHAIPLTAPDTPIGHDLDYCEKGQFRRCGEDAIARSLARSSGAYAVGGEPTNKDIIAALYPRYTVQDLACFKWLVQVAGPGPHSGLAQNNADTPKYKLEFEHAIEHTLGIHYTYDDFLSCYRVKTGEGLPDPRTFSTALFKPTDKPGATFFQRIMFEMDKSREPHITSVMKRALEDHDRVLAVYGSGHFVNERSTLESWLGPADVQCESD